MISLTEGGHYSKLYFAENKVIGWVLNDNRMPVVRVTDFDGNEIFYKTLDVKEWAKSGYGVHFWE
ncbi:MAG: hypothetical protein HFI38_06390 [Lachnospiraceae bacterium]|jgi:hypothetical protein|nr:hypothetical protein [Lachnospiraceae bacterium]